MFEFVAEQSVTNNPREMQRRIRALLVGRSDLEARYRQAKRIIRVFRRPAFYEISQKCNLWCEGCYYFEDKHRPAITNEMTPAEWEAFFEAERERGVSMAYLVGAEPALYMDRLSAASRNIRFGKIGTNGTIRIAPDVQFRIGISVWGDDREDAVLRGGSVLRKAFKNYEGDPRAIMLFTLSPWNLHTVDAVVRACADHGLPVTFSMFSPTQTYLDKIANRVPADDEYFRLAPTRTPPVFSNEDLRRTEDAVTEAMEKYPDTVLFSRAYGERVTRPGPLYDLDEATGIATNCASRIREPLRYHRTNGRAVTIKCCTPDVDCAHCRLYSGGWSSRFRPDPEFLVDSGSFERWLEIIEMAGRIFLYPYPFEDDA